MCWLGSGRLHKIAFQAQEQCLGQPELLRAHMHVNNARSEKQWRCELRTCRPWIAPYLRSLWPTCRDASKFVTIKQGCFAREGASINHQATRDIMARVDLDTQDD